MRLQQYILNERWHTRLEIRKNSFDVFVNPTKKEMKELDTVYLRFIADNTSGKLYIWDYDKGMHREVYKKLKISDNELFYGILRKKGNKWYFDSTDQIIDDYDDIMSDYEWLETYFILGDL
jgi:hypothetical protein